jgi:hypothetical protein
MRFLLSVLVAVTTVLTVASPVSAGPQHDARSDRRFVETMLYATSMATFQRTADSGEVWFDWSTDYCSAPLVGNTGRSFNFTAACRRHDFGYRNLHLLEQRYGSGWTFWNAASRKRVDKQFLADMKSHCHSRAFLLRPTCYGWAETFYAAVRVAGAF